MEKVNDNRKIYTIVVSPPNKRINNNRCYTQVVRNYKRKDEI